MDERLPDLERDVDWHGTIRVLHADVQRIKRIVEGNGQVGMQGQLTSLVATLEAQKQEREREHKANTARLNIIIALFLALAAWITLAETILHPSHSAISPPTIFHSQDSVPVLSYFQRNQQDSEIPPLEATIGDHQ